MGAVSSLFGACRSYLAPYTAEGAVNASALLQAAQSGDAETGKKKGTFVHRLPPRTVHMHTCGPLCCTRGCRTGTVVFDVLANAIDPN